MRLLHNWSASFVFAQEKKICFLMMQLKLCFSYLNGQKTWWNYLDMSRLMGKPTICLGENKGADQLRSNCEADQRLCFRYSDSTVPLLLKSESSRFYLFSVTVQVCLCRTWSETTLLVFPWGGSYIEKSAILVSLKGVVSKIILSKCFGEVTKTDTTIIKLNLKS